ncbi:hypothetical protein [Hydrogenophaga sp. NH-16]|uniref:hypothetical protein n=1 Tax=Hydrogenophaga sp. NH-16 TaxID=2184519 RepID=UPI001F4D3FCC|nr:hypothetical protein [Hydrogenophaga sp. NH-16]
MGDEADGLVGAGPELQQFGIQMVADDFVERAEGLVHQQKVGVEGERPGDRGALLHAARQLPGEFLAEAGEVDEVERLLDPLLLLLPGEAHDFERQGDVLLDGAPGIERRRLENIAVGAVLAGVFRRHAVDGYGARCVFFQIGNDTQEGGLAAAGGADEGDEVTLLHLEIDIGKRMDRPVSRLEGETKVLGGHDRKGSGHRKKYKKL